MNKLMTVVMVALVCGLCVSGSATVLHVPSEYPTIQAGIDAAAEGDTVLVADGTYTGAGNRDIDFGGKAILVASENGPASCIIDCQHAGRGFHFHTGETQGSEVRGFTICNSQTETIFCESASPTVADCVIRAGNAEGVFCWDGSSPMLQDCTITANAAGGVLCEYLCSPTITGCVISDNGCGGLAFYDQCSPTITGCDIRGNYDAYGGGGIGYGDHCFGTVEECTIVGNTAVIGGGIACDNYAAPTIAGNTIAENVAHHGGGIDCEDNSSPLITGNAIRANWCFYNAGGINCGYYSSPTIEECTITENIADFGDGGAIRCGDYSSPLIVDCLLKENRAEWLGGAVYCDYECDLILRNCVVAYNEAVWAYGGGLEFERSAPMVDNCTVVYNTSGDLGGGIACFAFTQPPEIINTIVWGNTPDQIYGDPPTVTYCDVEGGWTGEGNIDADPEFVLAEKNDYRLLWGSPCIDAGHPDSLDPDGTRSDMGAFFFDQDDYMTLYLTPDTTEISPGGALGVTYTAINRWAQPEPFWVLTEAILPNGSPFPVMGPDRYLLPAETTVQRHLNHNVPMAAPLGLYGYRSRIGVPPSTLYDEDSFEFWVVEP